MPSIGRRRLLAASAGGLAALAGCSALGNDDGSSTDPDPYRIGEVILRNEDDLAHEVDLLVRRDGEIVHWAGYELSASDEGSTADRVTVPASAFDGCTAGVYRVAVRVDGGPTEVFRSVSEPAHDGKPRVVALRGDGEFGYLAETVERSCSSPTVTAGE